MFAIQYRLTTGLWLTIDACGVFPDREAAETYMAERCYSIVYKRVVEVA